MKRESKIMTLVIVTMILAITFGYTLVTFFKDGRPVFGDVTGGTSTASASTYKDWSELSSIDNNYSYSTLFYTKDTKFYVNASNDNYVLYKKAAPNNIILPTINLTETGDHAQIIATNVGVDQEGNVLSAVFDITAADIWDHHSADSADEDYEEGELPTRGYIKFSVASTTSCTTGGTQANPNIQRGGSCISNSYNSPLKFTLSANVATASVKLTYYKNLELKNINETKYTTPVESEDTGSALAYAQIDTANSSVATSITKVNSFYYDIDIPRTFYKYDENNHKTTQYTDKIFQGKEGLAPTNGKTTIYYNKNGYSAVSGVSAKAGSATFNNSITNNSCTNISDSGCNPGGEDGTAEVPGYTSVTLAQSDNGIYCKKNDLWKYFFQHQGNNPDGYGNIDGIWYGQSTEFLTENVQGVYEFTYSGSSNGSAFIFYTPAGYTTDNPIKEVDKKQVTPGEEFVYKVKQYIPNNYASTLTQFHTIYSNLPSNNHLTAFSFEDEIDDRLTIIEDGITLTDINGNDLTKYYTINVTGNKITTTEKSTAAAFYETANAYNNYYILSVPVKYIGDVETEIVIPNEGKTTIKIGNENPETNTTNRVTTKIVPKIIKLTYDCKTNGGKEKDYTINMKAGDTVDLSRLCTKTGNKFLGWAETATDKTAMTTFTMPDHDTTIYGLYTPYTCDLILNSTAYTVDQTNKTINIPMEESDADILKNVSSKGEISIVGNTIVVKCDGEEQPYKINRYWIGKTGNSIIKWTLIITGFALVAVLGILVKITMNKKEGK